MKKTLLSLLLGLLSLSAVHAQQTVIVQRPGIFTDIATALVAVPAAALTGIVEGTVESVGSLINGSTTVVTSHVPAVVVPASVVMPQRQVVVCNAPHLSRVALRKSGKKVCFRGLRESVMPG